MLKHKYTILVFAGLAINLIETWLFGWHWHAQSGAEGFWDAVSLTLVIWGVVGDIATNLHIHKHFNNTTTVNTDSVEFKDGAEIMSYNVGIKNK